MTTLLALLITRTYATPVSRALLNIRNVDGVEIPHVRPEVLGTNSTEGFNILEHLAGISPYFDSPGVSLPKQPPPSCHVRTAAYIIRHSNIYANDFDYEQYIQPFTQKVFDFGSQRQNFSALPQLAFLANWSTPITNATEQVEKLTPSGETSAQALGKLIAGLYPQLIETASNASVFNVWTSEAERAIDSATPFIEGLFGKSPNVQNTTATSAGPTLVRVSDNETLSANTLVPHVRPVSFWTWYLKFGSNQSMTWINTYTVPIIQRFNVAIPTFNFTALDIYAMQQLCGYETVITNSSEFCKAFEPDDWLGFEYANDLMYWYSLGYGQTLSPTLGIPWLNATTALLTSPTPSQPLYFSFTHREEPPFILTALNLFNNSAYSANSNINSTMPTTEINYLRAWKTSEILPFLGHVALERLECEPDIPSFTTDSYVRALVNSAPIPIPGCQSGPGASCPLGEFMRYVEERSQTYGDFVGLCGIDSGSGNATNTLGIYQGNVPQVPDS
ncbi:unnamed protein product [Somion occarium]|uniref:Phosphoglycerate mutase-like protein n=1 Tax=Somion occarium TaxID=3059160 RepID=A0ABP1CNE2_9APHY